MRHRHAPRRQWTTVVLAAHEEHREGPDLLGPKLGVAPRPVVRILRQDIPCLSQLDSITDDVIRSSKKSARRFKREHPGELAHMGVKKLDKIPDDGGETHGRAATSQQE